MEAVQPTKSLDVRGVSCPMPIVHAREAAAALQPGQVLQILTTDRGSLNDFQAWVKRSSDLAMLDQRTETLDGEEVYVHFIAKR